MEAVAATPSYAYCERLASYVNDYLRRSPNNWLRCMWVDDILPLRSADVPLLKNRKRRLRELGVSDRPAEIMPEDEGLRHIDAFAWVSEGGDARRQYIYRVTLLLGPHAARAYDQGDAGGTLSDPDVEGVIAVDPTLNDIVVRYR